MYQRLKTGSGKEPKVALIARDHKLLAILNATAHKEKPWNLAYAQDAYQVRQVLPLIFAYQRQSLSRIQGLPKYIRCISTLIKSAQKTFQPIFVVVQD